VSAYSPGAPPPDGPDTRVSIFVRPLGSPVVLGFFAFAVGMFMLGVQSLQWVRGDEYDTVGFVLIAFVFPLEFLSSIVAYFTRDTLAATVLGLFATSWLLLGIVLATSPPHQLSHAVGFYLFVFSSTTLALALVAFLGKPLIGLLLLLSSARAILAGIHEFAGGQTLNGAAGVVALTVCGIAVYGGLALLFEDVLQRTALPVFRRGAGRSAMEGDLSEQLRRLEGEAGVRQQL
jgi:succinate-acetate transporter protein